MYKKSILAQISCYLTMFIMLSFIGHVNAAADEQQCQWVPVDQNNFTKILTMIENRVGENYNKIHTWQGKTRIVTDSIRDGEKAKSYYEDMTDVKPLPDKIKTHHEFAREFVMDANRGLLYESNYLGGQNCMIDANTGKNLPLGKYAQWDSGKYIRTPDYHIDCIDNKDRDGIVVSHTVIKKTLPKGEQTCQSQLPVAFDPRDTIRIFGDVLKKSSDPLGGALSKYLNLFKNEGKKTIDGYPTITVKECNIGEVKKYRIALIALAKDDAGNTVHSYHNLICSSEAGFNVVSYSKTAENDKVFEEKSFEYDLFNGVYLPVRKVESDFDYHTGDLKQQSVITYFNEKVNEPISDEVFTYKNLGLKNGDKFIDSILNKEYTYQDGELIQAEEKSK